MKTISEMEDIFKQTDLQINIPWLTNHQNILMLNKQYKDDMYKECNILIDMFCMQQIREVAYALSEESEVYIEDKLCDYETIIDELEIDFNLFVLIAGEDYFASDFYTDNFEESKRAIIHFLIDENYHKVVRILEKHYSDSQVMLENLIEDFWIYPRYQEAISEIETLEDMFDYPEIVKIYEWARSGFSIDGEQ